MNYLLIKGETKKTYQRSLFLIRERYVLLELILFLLCSVCYEKKICLFQTCENQRIKYNIRKVKKGLKGFQTSSNTSTMTLQREIKLEPPEQTDIHEFSSIHAMQSSVSFSCHRTQTPQTYLFSSPRASPNIVHQDQQIKPCSDMSKFGSRNTNPLSPPSPSSSTPCESVKTEHEFETMPDTPPAVTTSSALRELTSPIRLSSLSTSQTQPVPKSDSSSNSKTNFSIEEILKPTFGTKKSPDEAHRFMSSMSPEPAKFAAYPDEISKPHGSNVFRILDEARFLQNHSYDDQSDSNMSSYSTNSNNDSSIHANNNSVHHRHRSCDNNNLCEGHDQIANRSWIDYIASNSNIAISSNTSMSTDRHYLPWECYFNNSIPFTNALNHFFYGFDPSAFKREIFQHLNAPKSTHQSHLKLNPLEDLKTPPAQKLKTLNDNIKLPDNLTKIRDNEYKMPNKCKKSSNIIPSDTKTSSFSNSPTCQRKLTNVTFRSSSPKQQCDDPTEKKVPQLKERGNAPGPTKEVKKDAEGGQNKQFAWPAWVYCTRYSDRPSSGPRYRKPRKKNNSDPEKRPRTAFSCKQLQRLKLEFDSCPYLAENRRQSLADELGLNESQVKIWFQNKRAKLKKGSGSKNTLAMRLMEEGLYNHSTVVVDDNNDEKDTSR